MQRMTFADAIIDGLCHALRSDDSVSLIGSALLGLGPHRRKVDRIKQQFPGRLLDGPTSEAALAGLGAGAAMAGGRPFVDLGTASFALLAMPQIVNEAAVAHSMSGGQITAPVVYHMLHGVRGGGGAQHSTSPQALFWNSPGLQIVLPASPRDAKGLIRHAFKTNSPTVILNHAKLMPIEEDVPTGDFDIPFGQADIKRAGRDITIVATSHLVQLALEAARTLSGSGIEVEVLDLRTLCPLDEDALLASVSRTGRLLVVDECPLRCGPASEIAATVAERAWSSLKQAPQRLTRADAPIPCSAVLEAALTPDAEKIVQRVMQMMR